MTGAGAFAYQDEGVEFLRGLPDGRGILGDEPGLGKSRQALLAAEGRTLVLAPAMVLDGGVWADEVAKWRPDLDATLVPYSSLCGREKTPKGGTRPSKRARPEFAGPWDTLICDEAHYLKGRKTTWTEAVEALAGSGRGRAGGSVDRIYLLTGTPIPNWAHELFVPLRLCHPGEAGGGQEYGSYWRWVEKWFLVLPGRFNPQQRTVGSLRACTPACAEMPRGQTCAHWVEFHEANLGGVFLQRLRDDVLKDLPPLVEQQTMVDMVPAQKALYKALKRDFVAQTQAGMEVIAWSKSGLAVKLAKICTGVEVLDPASRGSAKIDALVERVRDQAQPSLVVAHFRDSCTAAGEALRRLGKTVVEVTGATGKAERREAVRGFQAGRFDVMVGSLATVAEGLTLTRADTVHFLERSWLPSRNEQALRRIHRIGQQRPVTAHNYVTRGTVDERVLKVLSEKTDQQMRALRPRDLAALL